MKKADYFQIGAKLIGIYYFIWGIISLVSALPSLLTMPRAEQAKLGLDYYYVPLIVVPVFLICGAVYLIKAREVVRLIEMGSDEVLEVNPGLREIFSVVVKLFGIYLIIGNLTAFASDLANYLWVAGDSSYGSREAVSSLYGRHTNVLPKLSLMLFGALLIWRGELLAHWAFLKQTETDNDHC